MENDDGYTLNSSVIYFYTPYEIAEEETGEPPFLFLFIGLFFILLLIFVIKIKGLRFNDYIYLKQWKIFPWFKPVIIGPMSITVDNKEIDKAEFYVDGTLNETVNSAPFRWQWNQNSLWKHTIETKVYDEDGNNVSSGQLEVFVFNPFADPSSLFTSAEKS